MSGGRRRGISITVTAGLAASGALVGTLGCEPYRVEYHTRPSFYQSASNQPLPDRLVRADGTVMVYRDERRRTVAAAPVSQAEMLQIWEEDESGKIKLRSIFPDHVISNAMSCVRLREWEVMWTQLISARSRETYLAEGKSYEDFVRHMEANREPLMETLNRMRVGYHQSDVMVDRLPGGGMRLRLSPIIAGQFTFTALELVPEGGGLRIAMIR